MKFYFYNLFNVSIDISFNAVSTFYLIFLTCQLTPIVVEVRACACTCVGGREGGSWAVMKRSSGEGGEPPTALVATTLARYWWAGLSPVTGAAVPRIWRVRICSMFPQESGYVNTKC